MESARARAPESAPVEEGGVRPSPPRPPPVETYGSDVGNIFAQYATQGGAAAWNRGQQVAEKEIARERAEQAGPARPAPSPSAELTLGDLIDFNPQALRQQGFGEAAELVEGLQKDTLGNPFRSEWGQQQLKNLRTAPLQSLKGFGRAPEAFEKEIAQLYFARESKRRGLPPVHQMSPDQYNGLLAEAREQARRQVAGVTGHSEGKDNALVELKSKEELAQDIRDADVPALTYLSGLPTLAKVAEWTTGTAPEDQAAWQLVSPFFALSRPGVAGIKEGEPVEAEGKLWWLLRMAPSTAVASWLLDPELTWELGGDNGWGGQKHLEKIVSGYDVLNDLGRVAQAYDDAVPWQAGTVEKYAAAAIPIGAAVLMEPDFPSLATGLVGAPLAKAAKGLKLGTTLVETALLPAAKASLEVLERGGTLDDIHDMAGPKGTVRRMFYDAFVADHVGQLVARAASPSGGLGSVKNIDPLALRNTDQLTQEAQQAHQDLLAELASNQQDITAAQQGLGRAQAQLAQANNQWAQSVQQATLDATAARQAYHQAEAAMVGAAAMRGGTQFNPGDAIIDLRTGQPFTYVGPGRPIAQAAGARQIPPRIQVTTPTGQQMEFPQWRFRRAGRPADARAILADLAALKQRRQTLLQQRQVALAAGDAKAVQAIDDQLLRLRGNVVANVSSFTFASAEAAYLKATDDMRDAVANMMKLRSTAPKVAGKTKSVSRAQELLNKALKAQADLTDEAMDAKRQADALLDSHEIAKGVLRNYVSSFESYVKNARAGTLEAQGLTQPVLDGVVQRAGTQFTVDGPQLQTALVAKYGQDAVQRATGQYPTMFSGVIRTDADGYQQLRKLEEAVHNQAEATRRASFGQAQGVLDTLGEFKGVVGWDFQTQLARGYQWAQYLTRAGDWVGAGMAGKMPTVVREVVRRASERFSMHERDLGMVAKLDGVVGMRDYLTSNKLFDGVVGNQDPMTLAEKALAYLRALKAAGGDAWKGDVVVKALANAPLPSFMSAKAAPGAVRSNLATVLDDPTFTGVQLVAWLEQVPAATYGALLGRADDPMVVMRFISRAIVQASSQLDVLYDLERTVGWLDEKAATAANWFFVPERTITADLAALPEARRAIQAYGAPKLSERDGAVAFLGHAKRTSNELINAARMHGRDVYVPEALWSALQEVPRTLAKDLAEFSTQSRMLTTFDRWSRLWRVSTVNGYVLPRAAHFVNTFAGDWSQMVQTYGWKTGTRIGLQTAVTYVPFVGARLQDALLSRAGNSSILSALLSPQLGDVFRADSTIIETADGPITARQFMKEAFEDGCFDSISTKDLQEATARHQQAWNPWNGDPPPWIEATARFMESIQHRQRVAVYLEARNGRLTGTPLGRKQARDALVGALYDWKTGIPAWEHQFIGRLASFWTYRRSMMRQLGAVLTEGLSAPTVEYIGRAMVGQTKLARTRQLGGIASELHATLSWQDPEAYLDDEEQVQRYGKTSAPWWIKAQPILANREVNEPRKLWYSEVAGREVTYEALVLPALTTADQLHLLGMVTQTALASTVMLAEQAGLRPSITTIGAQKLWEKNVDAVTDSLVPGVDDAINGALRPFFGRAQHEGSKGVPVPIAQAVLLRRLGLEDFMAAAPDPDGQLRVDPGAYGVVTNLALGFPPLADLARNWLIFAENPGYQESLGTGLLEAFSRWTGILKPQGFDPFRSADLGGQAAERELKAAVSGLRKQVEPRP